MTVDQAVQKLVDQCLQDDDTKEEFAGFKSHIRELQLTCGALEKANVLMVKPAPPTHTWYLYIRVHIKHK